MKTMSGGKRMELMVTREFPRNYMVPRDFLVTACFVFFVTQNNINSLLQGFDLHNSVKYSPSRLSMILDHPEASVLKRSLNPGESLCKYFTLYT